MALLPQQLSNVAVAALGKNPPVAEFFDRVEKILLQAPAEQPENSLLGKTYASLENACKPKRTEASQKMLSGL
jgi:hypothetical protein